MEKKSLPKKVVLGVLLAVVLVFAALFGQFTSTSVCPQCATLLHKRAWMVPLTPLPLYTQTEEVHSPVSKVLTENKLVPAHEHKWLFCHGGGNGISCAIGDGRHILPMLESDSMAAAILASHRYNEHKLRDRLIKSAFDSDNEITMQIEGKVPKGGFPDEPAFRAWLKQEATFIKIVGPMYRDIDKDK